MNTERKIRRSGDGVHQAVRIPRAFELPGNHAVMRKEGSRLVNTPVTSHKLLDLLKNLHPVDEDFAPISDPIAQADDP
jgi:antitoxin VapB